MPENKVSLKQLFEHLQQQIATKLTTNRKCIPHQGVKGDASEECWRAMLRDYLPKRYRVEKAFVVDSLDHCSDQIDIVIFDQQYSPFLFNQDGAYYVPAESVYAVIEAKQDISKAVIEYASEKAASVRQLKRTSAVFSTVSGPMKKASNFHIPAGIVALSTEWTPRLGESFDRAIQIAAEDDKKRIDFGCAIEGGAFDIAYEGIEKSHETVSLVTFLWKLVARLQALGTASAIEVPEYLKAIS